MSRGVKRNRAARPLGRPTIRTVSQVWDFRSCLFAQVRFILDGGRCRVGPFAPWVMVKSGLDAGTSGVSQVPPTHNARGSGADLGR